ncbi:MAG TPA: isochorismatase family cysteine hydrolase [Candidatus Saccharimonadales bacterium]|nr:isochorismatase family cysteine hydrolase [Candidatus Saccharimonadales bacterium]
MLKNTMVVDNLGPVNTALLVIDKQISYTTNNRVFGKPPNNKVNPFNNLVPKIDSFIRLSRSKGLEVIWTQMIEDVELSPPNIRNKMKADNTPTISSPNSKNFDFNGLGPDNDEKVIIKKYYDAFAQTDLDVYLKTKGVKKVIIIGGFTSRCVLGTAFGANGHGYNVIVVSDLTGNPAGLSDEVPVALGIINSVLGYTVLEKDILF